MLTRGREAQARASPDAVLAPLPRGFVHAVFLLLPVDTRLRCVEVSRAWRALLADASLWMSVDLSVSSGVMARCSEALLRAAVAKAGGQLRVLDITGQQCLFGVSLLRKISAANAATLQELRVATEGYCCVDGVRALLKKSPAFERLEAAVAVCRDAQAAHSMLRNEPPFQPLRLRKLLMIRGLDDPTDLAAFCSNLRVHASLEEVLIYGVALDTAAAMGAVVNACIAINLCRLNLRRCRVVPAALPELTRLIAAGALRALMVENQDDNVEMFDEAHESTRMFVAAVRASAMSVLQLVNMGIVPENVVEAAAFINTRQQ